MTTHTSPAELPLAPPVRDAIARFAGDRPDRLWRVSIHLSLPAARGFDDLASIGKRYAALCDRAEKRLERLGAPADEARRLAEALRSIAVEPDAFPVDARAVVVLAQDDRALASSVATPAPDGVFAGTAFHLRPILADLHANQRFRVAALADNEVALLEGDRWQLVPVEAPDVPRSLREVVGGEIARNEHTLQYHTSSAGGGAAVFHGHGGANRGREVDRIRFHETVARELRRIWSTRSDPLVLAADVAHQGPFRGAAELPGLLKEGLPGNHERATLDDLRHRAWPIVERALEVRDAERLAAVEDRLAHGSAASGFEPVLLATLSSQVERLWMDRDARMPGRLDESSGAVRPADGDEDVLDAIGALVLARGGEVVPVDARKLPKGMSLVAELRGGTAPGVHARKAGIASSSSTP